MTVVDVLNFAALDQVYLLLEVVKTNNLRLLICALYALLTKNFTYKAVC